MAGLQLDQLRASISSANATWHATELAASGPHALGWEPSPQHLVEPAMEHARRLMANDLSHAFASEAAAVHPRNFDWRSRGKIGPVTDQRNCGSCVSFATTGLVGAMTAIELNIADPLLSQADQHFCSSHGANCHGWNNGDALNQIKSRGVLTDADFPYMTGFDNPPKSDTSKEHLWIPHCHSIADRTRKTYTIDGVSAWTGDQRKVYLASVGPLVCGFKVYQDFDHYGGGVYKHVTGDLRGGHAVLVVGYSDDEGCWICRNSWGPGWAGSARPDGTGGGFFKIGYGQCEIDNEAFFGARGVSVRGWRGWWAVAGGIAAPNSSVFGTSRSQDKLDIFCVGTDHGTYTAAWEPNGKNWQGWWRIQNGVAAPDTSVTAVSRSKDKLDAFCVGTDHKVYTAAWEPNGKNWQGWWNIQGGVAAPNTSVFGVSRAPDHLDVFCVGTDHGTYTAAWAPNGKNWQGWWRIQGGVAAPDTSVTAVSRSKDKLDAFCVGTDHKVYTAAWEPNGKNWQGWWNIQGGVAAPGTSVFGTSRAPDHLDVFCVGTDMCVYTAAWEPNGKNWQGWWKLGEFKVAPGTSVYAVSKARDHIDIFAIGVDQGVYWCAWQPDGGWSAWWRVLNGAVAPGTMASAVVRSQNQIDLFVVGTDHHVYTAAWHR